jgi:hypothetical protein
VIAERHYTILKILKSQFTVFMCHADLVNLCTVVGVFCSPTIRAASACFAEVIHATATTLDRTNVVLDGANGRVPSRRTRDWRALKYPAMLHATPFDRDGCAPRGSREASGTVHS